jgi:hypothetical protein
MELLPAIANGAWVAGCLREYHRFKRALFSPADSQSTILRRLLSHHACSSYGQRHGFARLRNYADFARHVPLLDYEQAEPWIRRTRQGEPAVLTRDPVLHLIPTSGSAGPCKLIPFTQGLQMDFNRALAPWIVDLFRQEPGLAFGPAYWSISPAIQLADAKDSVLPIGFDDDSQYLGGTRRRLVNCVMAAPSALRFVQDTAAFRHLTLLSLLQHRDLRLISVWHPSFLTLLLEALPRHWDELLRDMGQGSSRFSQALPENVRQSLHLRPMPKRVTELAKADPIRAETIWPRLKVVSCWADGHASLAARELADRFPGTLIQPKGLLATEAIVTLPFQGRHPVAVESHFFEFIDAAGEVRLVQDLGEGECYDVVVTTSGGLWRYRLYDRVEVTGFVGRTPSLRFLGRSGSVSDRFGEKLSEAFVGETLRSTLATLQRVPCFAMLAPERGEGVWRYLLFADVFVPDEVVSRVEEGLRCNPHYDLCRQLGQLDELASVQVDGDAYAAFVAREMEHGRRLGEIKPVALSARENWSKWFEAGPVENPKSEIRNPK